jgi:hypothetical protein
VLVYNTAQRESHTDTLRVLLRDKLVLVAVRYITGFRATRARTGTSYFHTDCVNKPFVSTTNSGCLHLGNLHSIWLRGKVARSFSFCDCSRAAIIAAAFVLAVVDAERVALKPDRRVQRVVSVAQRDALSDTYNPSTVAAFKDEVVNAALKSITASAGTVRSAVHLAVPAILCSPCTRRGWRRRLDPATRSRPRLDGSRWSRCSLQQPHRQLGC